jgi:hypothetical protein
MNLTDTYELYCGGPGSGRRKGFGLHPNQSPSATISIEKFHRELAKLEKQYPAKPGEFPHPDFYTKRDVLRKKAGLDW